MHLEGLVAAVMTAHETREDRCEIVPMIRKRAKRARPHTAIISEAAKAKIVSRLSTGHGSP